VFVVAGTADLNFVQCAVATFVVVLATLDVASYAEIDVFHNYLRYTCAALVFGTVMFAII
jgi:hypothetical protein